MYVIFLITWEQATIFKNIHAGTLVDVIISHNHLLADLIVILGTIDFVLGSVDRWFA